jgi:hypothetical protein
MKVEKQQIFVLTGLILLAAMSRLLPHLPNFTPVGAMALFGAAHFSKKYWSFIIPITALWLSDLVLNNTILAQWYDGFVWFTEGFLWIAGAFVLIAALGIKALSTVTPLRLLGSSVLASFLFFAITNFSVWASGTMYPKNMTGLLACYGAGLPFFWNTFAGDLFYVTVLFGTYQFAQSRLPQLKTA